VEKCEQRELNLFTGNAAGICVFGRAVARGKQFPAEVVTMDHARKKARIRMACWRFWENRDPKSSLYLGDKRRLNALLANAAGRAVHGDSAEDSHDFGNARRNFRELGSVGAAGIGRELDAGWFEGTTGRQDCGSKDERFLLSLSEG